MMSDEWGIYKGNIFPNRTKSEKQFAALHLKPCHLRERGPHLRPEHQEFRINLFPI